MYTQGGGIGAVIGGPEGIDCPTITCSVVLDYGSDVILIAWPQVGSTFGGWASGCTGTDTCVLKITGPATVGVQFNNPNGAPYGRVA